MASFTGDSAYDRDEIYAEVAVRHPDAAVVVPPRANAVPSVPPRSRRRSGTGIYDVSPSAGAWAGRKPQGITGAPWWSPDISRWKRVIGDGLRFQRDGRQASEVAIAADVLNRMLDLGRPEYVRIA